jgi:hypothetical protein
MTGGAHLRAEGSPGFFSSVRKLSLQPGTQIARDGIRGYYIDLRVKAPSPAWPPTWLRRGHAYVAVCQWGLAGYERYIAGEGERWLAAALSAGAYLIDKQVATPGSHDGGWQHVAPPPHTHSVRAPWLSALAQGEAASLLTRLYAETGEERFAGAAIRALRPLTVPSRAGGVQGSLDGAPFPEEYPTTPPSLVLNGGIFATWGCYDVWKGLGEADSGRLFADVVETLACNLLRWDTGHWSRYDLYPYPVMNVASSAYHALHISQLRAMNMIVPRSEFTNGARTFEAYRASRLNRARAFAEKVAFRLVVPRSGRRARRWTRG